MFWIGDYERASDTLYELAEQEFASPELEHTASADILGAVCAKAAMLDDAKVADAADMLKRAQLGHPAFAKSCARDQALWVVSAALHSSKRFLDRVQRELIV
jgi:hypothetical protein